MVTDVCFSFLSLVKKRKLQWFGHVTRAKGTLAHTTLQGKAEGGRLRGRPRRTWTSDLKEWTGHPLSHLTSLAENRPGWISLVDSLVAPTAVQTAMHGTGEADKVKRVNRDLDSRSQWKPCSGDWSSTRAQKEVRWSGTLRLGLDLESAILAVVAQPICKLLEMAVQSLSRNWSTSRNWAKTYVAMPEGGWQITMKRGDKTRL
ncbi:hypothetical protein Bbelb_114950 [Branchiostoma belcheri]|nr:hypothetical protein Bbelb_114950 [Branchiostoma belcheri]